jgi:hypothetical protein
MLFSALKWTPTNNEQVITPLFLEDTLVLGVEWKKYTHWKNLTDFCVYAYLREEDDEYGPKNSVRYVGEGAPKRIISKTHRVRVPSPDFIMAIDGITKKKARELEEVLIKKFGRISKNSGILENINHKFGGGDHPKPPRKIEKCKFCEKEYAHIQYHEDHCNLNPDRKRGTKKHSYVNCQHCGEQFTASQSKQHERRCSMNPTPSSVPHKILKCKFCEREVLSSAMPQHERSCQHNPERVAGPGTGLSFEKVPCKFCHNNWSKNNIDIHERSCKLNPNRVPGVRAGKCKTKDK